MNDPNQSPAQPLIWNTNDHDMLVTLNAKMDGLAASFNSYYTDITLRVSKLENKMEQEDVYHAGIDLAHFKNNSDWVDNFRANQHFLWTIGGILISLSGGIVAILISKVLHF